MHAALMALILPMSLYAVGLGDMKVESSLGEPLVAEIELIDVGSASLGTLRVGLADPENFERIGIERIAVLSLLEFKVEKNKQGKLVIKVQSKERMTEPYMELIVDLAWPKGQLFKTYTVLLDPPGYQLLSSKQQMYSTHYKKVRTYNEPGVVDKTIISTVSHNPNEIQDSKNQTTYGPTITNENVWQIAQRYKTSEVILPQVVLAIVGANPEAFTDGNLNGLKVGVRLVIPATRDIQQVPADLATQEVMAHDTAWNEKKTVNHVISPPYMGYQAKNMNEPDLESELPAVPKFTQTVTPSLSSLNKLISVNSFMQVAKKEQPQPAKMQQTDVRESTTKAEIAITTAAVETVRESNALLKEQLHLLQEQNKKLQQQLESRDKDMQLIRSQLQVITKDRKGVASEASSATNESDSSNLWPVFLLLLGVCGGGGSAFWYLRRRDQENDDTTYLANKLIEPRPFIPEMQQETETPKAETVTSAPIVIQDSVVENKDIKDSEVLASDETETVKPKSSKKKKSKSIKSDVVSEPDVAPKEKIETKEEQDNFKQLAPMDFEEHTQHNEKIIEVQPLATDLHSNSIENEPVDAIKITNRNADIDAHETEELADLEFEPYMEPKSTEAPKEARTITVDSPISPLENELLSSIKTDIKDRHSDEEEDTVEDLPDLEFEPSIEPEATDDEHALAPEETSSIEKELMDSINQENAEKEEEDSNSDMLEFESGLHQIVQEEPEPKVEHVEDEAKEGDEILESLEFESSLLETDNSLDIKEESFQEPEESDLDMSMDFLNEPSEEVAPDADSEDVDEFKVNTAEFKNIISSSTSANPLKSSKALDTLLSLAKTYIGMDDFESAKHSLDEVMEHGNDAQKEEAQRLLNELNNK